MNELTQILNELIYFREVSSERTKVFKKLKHNNDLCPTIERKLNYLLSSFERYRNKVHDIQGVHDKGTDVFFRKYTEEGSEFVCIQIKSHDDLRKKDYLKILKAQYFDSNAAYTEMIDYYILICCDTSNKKFKNKVREIAQAFSKNTDVHVVEPEFSISFYLMNRIQIDAIVKNLIGNEDIMIKEVKKLFLEHTPTEIALLIYFCYERLFYEKPSIQGVEDLMNVQFLMDILNSTESHSRDWFFIDENEIEEEELDWILEDDKTKADMPIERINEDLDHLENYTFENEEGLIVVNQDSVFPLLAIMLDGKVRYGYDGEELMYYVFELSKPLKGFIE